MKWYEMKPWSDSFGGELTPADKAKHDKLVANIDDAERAVSQAKFALAEFQAERGILTDIGGTDDPCYKKGCNRA